VDVQPYAFTTKSLFVGHMDYKYLRWQVLDTPGILDQPLESRNTIEMQAITALAHLNCCVIYFLDVSQQCGFTIEQQASLFENIKPLFAAKPLFIVANKTDIKKWTTLKQTKKKVVDDLVASSGAKLIEMSALTEDGVMAVKTAACDELLRQRVKSKVTSRKIGSIKNRVHVAMPKKRDGRRRASSIPESVLRKRAAKKAGVADMDEDGAKSAASQTKPHDPHAWGRVFDYKGKDLTQDYDLKNDEWKTDIVPEIMDGKNIADFVDADILQKLDALEKEEEALVQQAAMMEDSESDIDEDKQELVGRIRAKRSMMVRSHRREKGKNRPVVPKKFRKRTVADLKSHLDALGVETKGAETRGRKRHRSLSRARPEGDDATDDDKKRARSRSRSVAVKAPHELGVANEIVKKKVAKMAKLAFRKRNRNAKKGPGDRVVLNLMPKHLYSGKRGIGSTDRR